MQGGPLTAASAPTPFNKDLRGLAPGGPPIAYQGGAPAQLGTKFNSPTPAKDHLGDPWPEGWTKYEEPTQPQPIAAFEAWIPQIKSGILIGQGAQVKLEMAESDIEAALALARDGRDKVLRVVIFDAQAT